MSKESDLDGRAGSVAVGNIMEFNSIPHMYSVYMSHLIRVWKRRRMDKEYIPTYNTQGW